MEKTKILRSTLTKNMNYIPKGYYDYPELSRCISMDSITLKYSSNYMYIKILPHRIRIKRQLHRKDRILFPDGKAMLSNMGGKNGKDLAGLLHKLDQHELIPLVPWYKVIWVRVLRLFGM